MSDNTHENGTDVTDDDSQSKPSLYLCGPIKEVEDSGAGWREELKASNNRFDFIDPLDKYSPEDDQQPTAKEIVETDLKGIHDADGVLVHFEEQCMTMGTPMEMYHATMNQIPVFVAWDVDCALSPWAEHYASTVDGTVRDAVTTAHAALNCDYDVDEMMSVGANVERYVESEAATDIEAAYDERGDDDVEDWTDLEKATPTTEELSTLPDDHGQAPPMDDGDEMAAMVADDVSALLTDSRDTHGDAIENQQHISEGWNWYLGGNGKLADGESLTGTDVARMMMLVKASRSAVGSFDVDHDRDIAGYAAISAACSVDRGDANLNELQQYVDSGESTIDSSSSTEDEKSSETATVSDDADKEYTGVVTNAAE